MLHDESLQDTLAIKFEVAEERRKDLNGPPETQAFDHNDLNIHQDDECVS